MKLRLQLSHDHVHASFLHTEDGMLPRIARLPGRRGRRRPVPSVQVTLRAASALSELPSVLAQAVTRLALPLGVLAGAALEVQLGQRFAHLGLMTTSDGVVIPAGSLEIYIQAWVQETMRIDPGSQIVRWQANRDGHSFTVSCVDRAVSEMLQDFGVAHGLRFSSCRPALLCACNSHSAAGPSSTLVWTEQSHDGWRTSPVQLVLLESGEPKAFWRGWLPPMPPLATHDPELESALFRFQQCYRVGADNSLLRLHWPFEAVVMPSPGA